MAIRTINDPSGLSAELVERLVGLTAYDVVKTVAMYLPEIQALAPSAEAIVALGEAREQLLLLVPEIPELLEIAEHLEEIINGQKPASAITYNGETLDIILARLLFQSINIMSFTASPTVAEVGSVVQSVDLAWVISRSGNVQRINGTSITPSLRAYTYTVPIGVTSTFTLRLEEGTNGEYVFEATATVAFKRRRYWGTSANPSLSDAEIRALTSEFADDRVRSVVFNASGGKYPYYAYPASFGLPASIKVQGVSFSDYTIETRNFVNAFGASASYHIIRFNTIQTGSNIEVSFA